MMRVVGQESEAGRGREQTPITGVDIPPETEASERRRRLQVFQALPKTQHGAEWSTSHRHADVDPDEVVAVIENPRETWSEVDERGQNFFLISGAVPRLGQWVKVVFQGTSVGAGLFDTAYQDRRLAKHRYGERPWQNPAPVRSPNPNPS